MDFKKGLFRILTGKYIQPIWRIMKGDTVGIRGKVVLCLTDPITGEVLETHETENIVGNAGDLYYSERGALLTVGATISPVPTNFTDTNGVPDMQQELYDNTGGVPGKASDRSDAGVIIGAIKALDSGFPKVNDSDADNTGAGVDIITYKVTYTTAQVNGAIDEVIITNPAPGASEPVILFADGLNTTKTTANGLKTFVNHEMLGV